MLGAPQHTEGGRDSGRQAHSAERRQISLGLAWTSRGRGGDRRSRRGSGGRAPGHPRAGLRPPAAARQSPLRQPGLRPVLRLLPYGAPPRRRQSAGKHGLEAHSDSRTGPGEGSGRPRHPHRILRPAPTVVHGPARRFLHRVDAAAGAEVERGPGRGAAARLAVGDRGPARGAALAVHLRRRRTRAGGRRPGGVALERVEVSGPQELYDRFLGRPVDLAAQHPVRAVLARVAPDEHLLLVEVHHIAVDGWSWGVLLEELAAGYRGTPSPHPPSPTATSPGPRRSA